MNAGIDIEPVVRRVVPQEDGCPAQRLLGQALEDGAHHKFVTQVVGAIPAGNENPLPGAAPQAVLETLELTAQQRRATGPPRLGLRRDGVDRRREQMLNALLRTLF